jgi:hypothetical protein
VDRYGTDSQEEGKIMMGPLTSQEAGRMWAKAFIDEGYKGRLEQSPLAAAEELYGQSIKPLFDWTKSYLPIFFATLSRTTNPFSAVDLQNILDNNFGPLGQEKRKALRDSLKGNKFTLLKKDLTKIYDLEGQDMGGPPGPAFPLMQHDWIRIYTKAFMDQSGFLVRLTEDPAKAIDEFKTALTLNHTSGAPIVELPIITELQAIIPAGELNSDALRAVLTRIANGADPQYETNLKVNLSC